MIGTIRRECLDFMVPPTERHLRVILREWITHYNRGRPHSSLGPGLPDPPPDRRVESKGHQLPDGYRVSDADFGRTPSRIRPRGGCVTDGMRYLRTTGQFLNSGVAPRRDWPYQADSPALAQRLCARLMACWRESVWVCRSARWAVHVIVCFAFVCTPVPGARTCCC